MRIVENIVDDYKLKKYGRMALELNTSTEFLKGRRSVDGIKIEELLSAAHGNFLKYQELIGKELNQSYKVDFLDFSLLMGIFFGVYNYYCFEYINKDVRKILINNVNISRTKTLEFIKNNCQDIYNYLYEKFCIDKDYFIKIVGSLFKLHDDDSLYNDEVVKEIAYILMGNYLYLEDNSLQEIFRGSAFCVQYFEKKNNNDKKIRVI